MAEKRIYFDMGCSECQRSRDKLNVPPDLYEEIVGGVLVTFEGDGISVSTGHEGGLPYLELKDASRLRAALGRAIKHGKEMMKAKA